MTAETQRLKAALVDADEWLARWELDAVYTETVEGARALRDRAAQDWQSHCEFCEYFAEWSRPIMKHHVYMMDQFKSVK